MITVLSDALPSQVENDALGIPGLVYCGVVLASDDDSVGKIEWIGEAAKGEFPSDPLFCGDQHYLHARGQGETPMVGDSCAPHEEPAPVDMDLPQAWAITMGEGAKVAVIDNLVDWRHPDFADAPTGGPYGTVADSMIAYGQSSIFMLNPNEVAGDLYGDQAPGEDGVDDDNDGQIDEDIWGLGEGNTPEADVMTGVVADCGVDWIVDASAPWDGVDLTGKYLTVPLRPDFTSYRFNLRIVSNTASKVTVAVEGALAYYQNYIHPSVGIISFVEAFSDSYKIGDGINSDPAEDSIVDDLGHQPSFVDATDDDENGYGDDIFALRFTSATEYSNDPRPSQSPESGDNHGSRVLGVLGSRHNGIGSVGVAPDASILFLSGASPMGILLAIDYAIEADVDIISLAYNDDTPDCSVVLSTDSSGNLNYPFSRAIQRAFENGILVVNGSGNDGEINEANGGLNCLDEMISVAGIRADGAPWGSTDSGTWVDISARAPQVTTTDVCWIGTCNRGDAGNGLGWTWVAGGGTSFSAPQVSGVLALMRSVFPEYSAMDLRTKLLASTDPILNPGSPHYPYMGSGAVNAYKALTFYGDVPSGGGEIEWAGEVWVSGDVHVPVGSTLRILPGTTIHVAQDDILEGGDDPQMVEFFIEGTVDWTGTPGNSITFEAFADSPSNLWIPPAFPDPPLGTVSNVEFVQFQEVAAVITEPNGSETYDLGNPITIAWSTDSLSPAATEHSSLEFASTVDLAISTDGGQEFFTVASGIAASLGEYEWTPTEGHIGSTLLAKVVFLNAFNIQVGEDVSDGTFTLQASTTFVNRSSAVQLNSDAAPFATLLLDADGDGDQDLLLSVDGDAGSFHDNIPLRDLPRYSDETINRFNAGEEPFDTRGGTVGDYTGDGADDVFLTSETSRHLYLNDGSGDFDDQSGSIGGFNNANDSWTGSWVDYDRDGDLDLFIGRAGTSGSGTPYGALPDQLFQNNGAGGLGNVTQSLGLDSAGARVTAAAAWGDFNLDGEVDYFAGGGSLGDEAILYVQSIDSNGNHSFTDSPTLLPTDPAVLDRISDVEWVDLNNDGYLDLLISGRGGGADASRILWNDQAGGLTTTSLLAGGSISTERHATGDLDLDGDIDVVGVPSGTNVPLDVLVNQADGADPTFLNQATALGLGDATSGQVWSVALEDLASPDIALGADGDPDLLVGRPSATGKFFFQNTASQVASGKPSWLGVQFSNSSGLNNSDGTGCRVTLRRPPVSGSSLTLTQIVGGGSGTDGRRHSSLIFGLGTDAGDVELEVVWPDGTVLVDTYTSGEWNTFVTVDDAHTPGLTGSTATAYSIVDPGGIMDMVFEWTTARNSDVQFDEVTVRASGKSCSIPETTLTYGQNGVTMEIFAASGGGYRHRVTWDGQPCQAPCPVEFKVKSCTNTDCDQTAWKQFTIPACIN